MELHFVCPVGRFTRHIGDMEKDLKDEGPESVHR